MISIAKTTSKKIGALTRSMKFLSPEVVLCHYESTIRPCMEYCCHVWAGVPSCYLEFSDKLPKRICSTIGPTLAASLEPLAHRRNVTSLSLFYRYYFGRCVTVPNLKGSYNSRYIKLIVYFLIIDTNGDISPVVHPSNDSRRYVYNL